MSLKALQEYTFISRYAKYNKNLKRREKWIESVERVENMHLERYPQAEKEIKWAFEKVKQKKVLGAQRALQFGGDAIKRHHARMYNCFHQDTEFVTSIGVQSFSDFNSGDTTTVLTHKGQWKKAVVKSYGEQDLYEITFNKGIHLTKIIATKDHRWILHDGTNTTNLKIGDRLYKPYDTYNEFNWDTAEPFEKLYWCYGFVYGDGTRTGENKEYSVVRLCGNDVQFLSRFEEMGFTSSSSLSLEGDVIVYTGKYKKESPNPEKDNPKLIRAFVSGYLQADGCKNSNPNGTKFISIQSSELDHINFIRKCFPIAGVWIISETDLTGQVTNFGTRDYTINFKISTTMGSKFNAGWRVKDIKFHSKNTVWCLEVEDDNSFIMPNGITTGNCISSYADRLCFFQEALYLLLCGCGVGFSVQKHHIEKLPNFLNDNDFRIKGIKTYVIPDSIEGWADSLGILLSTFFQDAEFPEYQGYDVEFDFSLIRPKGAPLSYGGKAPGPEPLKKALQKIKSLLSALKTNGYNKPRPIDVYDIVMHSSDAVLAGGIRRSATICLFSHDDEDMIKAKTGNWFIDNPQRARSNNSVVLIKNEVTLEQFKQIMESVKQYGEPGFVFADSYESLFNPCVTADTLIQYKKNGVIQQNYIQYLNGETITIWNGEEWSDVKVEITGYHQKTIKVTTLSGKELTATPSHQMILNDGRKIPLSNLQIGDRLTSYIDHECNNIQVDEVIKLEKGDIADVVYCFTEPKRNQAIFNGILTGQCVEIGLYAYASNGKTGWEACNLSEINGKKIKTLEDFLEIAKAAAIIGTLQAGYTDFNYLSPETKEIIDREALIGVSITGIMDSPEIILNPENQRLAAEVVKQTNKEIAALIGINPAARTTCVKPAGSTSCILGTSSGIHPHHARRYFRRVQANKMEAPAQYFESINPLAVEESVWSANQTDNVLTFCIEVPDGSKTKNEMSALDLLKMVQLTQQNWVESGTNLDLCVQPWLRHNVSNTINVKEVS